MQHPGTRESKHQLQQWINGGARPHHDNPSAGVLALTCLLPGVNDLQTIHPGDWIIQDAPGVFHILTNEEFNRQYEEITPETPTAWINNDNHILITGVSSLEMAAHCIKNSPHSREMLQLLTPETPNATTQQILSIIERLNPGSFYLPEVLLTDAHWSEKHVTPCRVDAPEQWQHLKITRVKPPPHPHAATA